MTTDDFELTNEQGWFLSIAIVVAVVVGVAYWVFG